MVIIFNKRNKSNHNVKIIVNILNSKPSNKQKKLSFSYNDKLMFCYYTFIDKSKININIYPENNQNTNYINSYIGSFIYIQSENFSADSIEVNCYSEILSEKIVFEFLQKDFIFNNYLKSSFNSKYKTSYKLKSKFKYLLSNINFLKELVSEPSNVLYPQSFANRIKRSMSSKKIIIDILSKKQIQKLGLRCLLSVSQGSKHEPRVVKFQNRKKNKSVDILFVGKGVTFDSGGISIKPSQGMEDMKWDMAGAAVVSAIIRYLSSIKTNFSYAGIIGLVENMPDGNSYKPGDIIKSYKGINVEVLNTDAEGRLVLADIISYGCEVYKPKVVIDFATLTGAIMIALGQHFAGLYSNDDKLAETLYDSGLVTNEKVWRMPLHEDFDKELNSPFVDLKNISNSRYGGSVTAAQFLQRFVPKNTKWAHLDIAGVTWKTNGDKMNNKGATGFGLTLISDFIDKYF